MSILSNRRALVLAGLSGILLAGGALATSTAAHADDGSTSPGTKKVTPADADDPAVTIADAADAAESKYPDCDVTAALLYDTAASPVWDVELTCESGTVKYVTVDGATGKVADDGSRTDDTGAADGSASDDDGGDDWWSTADDKSTGGDTSTGKDKKSSGDDKSADKDKSPTADDKSADDGDAPGTGANADYS